MSDPVDGEGGKELSSDIFPLVLLYAFFALICVHPFGRDTEEASESIKNQQPMPLNVKQVRSVALLQLLIKMISYDPSKRPTTSQILDHPFFTQQPRMAPARLQ